MPRPSGGFVSGYATPTVSAARGVWSLRDSFNAQRLNSWPISPTVLLLNANGANGSTSFVDSSRYARTITASGDPVISTAQSKFGGSSIKFSNGYISAPASSNFNLTTSNFAIEMFAYFTSGALDQRIGGGDLPTTTGNFNWGLYTTSNNRLDFYISSTGTSWNVASGSLVGNISTNQWYHVAVVRTGTTISGYLNGVRGSAVTSSASIFSNNSNGPVFGKQGTSPFTGYLDDIRITVGSDRNYIGTSFTPPSDELVP